MSIDVARHRETSIDSIDVVVVVAQLYLRPSAPCIDVYRRRETSRDIGKIYRRRRRRGRRPALRPSAPPTTCIDVYRRRETSRDIDKIYRRRRRRPGLRPSAPPIYYMYRRRETPRDIDKICRRRETSRDIDKIYRRRETSIKILYPYSFLIVWTQFAYLRLQCIRRPTIQDEAVGLQVLE